MDDVERVVGAVVDSGVKLHIRLGPGLLESAYESLLAQLLRQRGFQVEQQKIVDLRIDGIVLEHAFRIDLLVNDLVLVEVKSVERLAPVHVKQVLTYLKCVNLPIGLLMNFGASTMKEGLQRVVNGYRVPDYKRPNPFS